MEHVCELTGICKQYRSRKTLHEVLHDVSMTLDAGEVLGSLVPTEQERQHCSVSCAVWHIPRKER